MGVSWGGEPDIGGRLSQISSPIPPPPSSILGAGRVPFLQLGVCRGSGSSGGSGQEVGKGHSGSFDYPGVGYYSHLFLVQKMTGRWELVIDLLALSLCDPTFQDGDGGFGHRADHKRGQDVLNLPEGRVIPDTQSPGL